MARYSNGPLDLCFVQRHRRRINFVRTIPSRPGLIQPDETESVQCSMARTQVRTVSCYGYLDFDCRHDNYSRSMRSKDDGRRKLSVTSICVMRFRASRPELHSADARLSTITETQRGGQQQQQQQLPLPPPSIAHFRRKQSATSTPAVSCVSHR